MKGRGGWLVLGIVAVLVAIAVGGAGTRSDRPLDPGSVGPQGAKAVVDLLEELGADVGTGSRAGDADTALLLEDRLSDEGHRAAVDFVEDGGVLVVADPSSPIATIAGVEGASTERCPAALDDVRDLRFAPGPGASVPRQPGCFDGTIRVGAVGEGQLVLITTPRFFVNELLAEGDNSVLAAALLAPSGEEEVAFLTADAGGGEPGLLDLISPSVGQAVAQLAVAAVLYVLWRGRRLGRPVAERQPVRVAGSELVAAVGRLLAGRRRPADAAAALRADARRRLLVQVGLPPTAPLEAVAAAVAARTGTDPATVADVLERRPVTTDDELRALAAALDDLTDRLLQPTGGTRP